MTPEVANSLSELKRAFLYRSRPRSVPHCGMCYRDDEIERFLAIPYEGLLDEDLQALTSDGYICWGTWREVAYYIPRLLELWADDLIVFEDRMFTLILYPVRPETGFWAFDPRQECDMDAAERGSIADFVGEGLLAKMARGGEDNVWRMTEPMTFLGCFPEPVEPLLNRIATHADPRVRGNFALFLAENLWSIEVPPLTTQNKAAFDNWLAPSAIAQYLLDHTDEIALFGEHRAKDAALAFDYAMKQAEK